MTQLLTDQNAWWLGQHGKTVKIDGVAHTIDVYWYYGCNPGITFIYVHANPIYEKSNSHLTSNKYTIDVLESPIGVQVSLKLQLTKFS